MLLPEPVQTFGDVRLGNMLMMSISILRHFLCRRRALNSHQIGGIKRAQRIPLKLQVDLKGIPENIDSDCAKNLCHPEAHGNHRYASHLLVMLVGFDHYQIFTDSRLVSKGSKLH